MSCPGTDPYPSREWSYAYHLICQILINKYQNRLLSDIDDCKASTKKLDDSLQKTKDEITEKLDKEIKEV